VSQTDGQFRLLAVFSRDWKVDEPWTRMASAWVDSQCERTREALVQALRNDVRFLTLLKSNVDADVESELLDDCHNSRHKKTISMVPRTSTPPRDIIL
ncbi:hypothetical protein K443DRAFT_110450, partial [Laccaria amethystina LaAM-08-1]